MYPRKKNWTYSKSAQSSPVKAIEIMNPNIITAEASEKGVLIDSKTGKETSITFKKPKAKPKPPIEDIDMMEEPRKKPAQRLLETLQKEKKEVIRPIDLMVTKNRPRKTISDEDKKRIRDIIQSLN